MASGRREERVEEEEETEKMQHEVDDGEQVECMFHQENIEHERECRRSDFFYGAGEQ